MEAVKSNWLVRLLEEVDRIEAEIFSPNHQVGEGEKIIGVAEPYERKLYALQRICSKERDANALEAKYHSADESCEVFSARIDEMNDKASAINSLLWCCVQDRLKLWGSEKEHGLRAKWQIVEMEPESHSGLPPALRKILGLD